MIGALGALAVPPAALGATTIGQTDSTGMASCNPNGTWVQDSTTATGPSYTVPAGGGVITSWQHDAALTGSTMRLKAFRKTAADEYLTVGHSALAQLTIVGLNTFPTRFSVQGGDLLGIRTEDGDTRCREGGVIGDLARSASGLDPPVGSSIALTTNDTSRLNIAASLEPDCDADGFGDETQDPLVDCVAPETTITKGAPNKTDRSRIKFKFSANEPDSTFECRVDQKPFKPCGSPKTVKHLEEGKHKFKVRAIDAVGNVDPSAAKDKFKVVD